MPIKVIGILLYKCMNRKKRSPIWKIDRDKLTKIVRESETFSKILSYFDLINKGGNVKTLKARLDQESINYFHIKQGRASNKGRRLPNAGKFPLERVLVEGSTYSRCNLKMRLLSEGLIEYKCYICGISEWLGEKLSLQLDHINGVSNDNRRENLRLLCPNCHSQTPTFTGRHIRKNYIND